MRFYEMSRLPRSAGLAVLEYEECEGRANPFRSGRHLHLPGCPDAEFFPLRGGEQFLLRHWRGGESEPQIWFGGTDEQPFLVRLGSAAFSPFMRGGEDGFFAGLRPAVVNEFEVQLRLPTRRQGDIFALPLPYKWREIVRGMGRGVATEPETYTGPVFGTRHMITSPRALQLNPTQMIAEGLLEAPDHGPLRLDVPHLLSQTAHLHDPQRAD